jgi:hypothetical protein
MSFDRVDANTYVQKRGQFRLEELTHRLRRSILVVAVLLQAILREQSAQVVPVLSQAGRHEL